MWSLATEDCLAVIFVQVCCDDVVAIQNYLIDIRHLSILHPSSPNNLISPLNPPNWAAVTCVVFVVPCCLLLCRFVAAAQFALPSLV